MYEKEVVVSFDLSTVTVGYCITKYPTEEIIDLNYFKFNGENILDKMVELEIFIETNIINKYSNINTFIIEERLKSFRGGGTSAAAMLKLAIINFVCQFILFKKKIKIKEINVNSARSLTFPLFHSVARKLQNIKQKDYAFQLALKQLGPDRFPTKINKSGKNKGKTVFLDEAKDMADSWILSRAFFAIKKQD